MIFTNTSIFIEEDAMISYERFKEAVRSDLKSYLPGEYADH